ncbi:MAG: type II secretion system F family protein [Pseudomonadota bacterium]
MEAPDVKSIVSQLHRKGQTPLSIEEGRSSKLTAALQTELFSLGGMSQKDVLAFTRSLATLMNAGIALDRALEMVARRQTSQSKAAVLEDLLSAVREGKGFAAALEAHPNVFSPFYRNMVRAGEAGASIPDVLQRLSHHLETSQRFQSRFRSALIYPAFLMVAALGAILILLTVVVPTFAPMFEDAGAALPTSTAIVIAIGSFFQAYWIWLALAALAICVGLFTLNANPAGQLWWHHRALSLPFIGQIWVKSSLARIARTLAVLLENGLGLLPAMHLAQGVSSNRAISAAMDGMIQDVDHGRGLAAPFEASGLFPALACELIQVGEESGKLDPMLHKLADIYEEETTTTLERLLSLLVPTLTLVVGLLIAFIVSSILFALFSINELAT